MKKRVFLLALMSLLSTLSFAQSHEFANWARYHDLNVELGAPAKGEKRVVILGNSITEFWVNRRPEFFKENGLVGRGICGQTSYQFLLRFREDVVNLKPTLVVINYGTNDIGENTGWYNEDITFGNVCTMVDIARANNIKVILTSCLPAECLGWRKPITDAMPKIVSLNARVKAYAKENKIPYVDYFSAMVNEDGTAMKAEYAKDSPAVHPNDAGYEVMESLLLPVIKKKR